MAKLQNTCAPALPIICDGSRLAGANLPPRALAGRGKLPVFCRVPRGPALLRVSSEKWNIKHVSQVCSLERTKLFTGTKAKQRRDFGTELWSVCAYFV
jgi:hypothetical protein